MRVYWAAKVALEEPKKITSEERLQGISVDKARLPLTETERVEPFCKFMLVLVPTDEKFLQLSDSLPMPFTGQTASTVPPEYE